MSNYKFTHFIDICPLCKDDLLHLPKKVATKLGSIGRTILVKNVSSVIHLVDPFSGQTAEMPPAIFYRSKFRPLVTAARAHYCRYVVLSKEAVVEKVTNGKRSTSKQVSERAKQTSCEPLQTYKPNPFAPSSLGAHSGTGSLSSPL